MHSRKSITGLHIRLRISWRLFSLFLIYSNAEMFPLKKDLLCENWFREKIVSRLNVDLTKIVKVDRWLRFGNESAHLQLHVQPVGSAGGEVPANHELLASGTRSAAAEPGVVLTYIGCSVRPKAVPFTGGGAFILILFLLGILILPNHDHLCNLSVLNCN